MIEYIEIGSNFTRINICGYYVGGWMVDNGFQTKMLI
jgi:hypothetical protein